MIAAAGEFLASGDAGLECDADNADPRPTDGGRADVQRRGTEADDMARHRQVDVACRLDESVDEVELTRPPSEVVRIDRDAMAADAGPRREPHETKRLRARGVEDLPNIETHPLAKQRELIHQGDVDVAKDVLVKLGQFSRVRRREPNDSIGDPLEESSCPLARLGRKAPDEPRNGRGKTLRVSRVDPLRREC